MLSLPQPGSLFDGAFRITDRLGEGAVGAVLGATRVSDGELVALKLLRPELADDVGLRRRFNREASLLQSFSHPAVVRVLGQGEADGMPYFAMVRLKGGTLRSRIALSPLSPATFAPILRRIASALTATHDHGVLHGDVKPENIFLTDEGAILVDFGSCKIHGLPRLTATGDLVGTPLYAPPELIRGSRDLDGRVDVYALGISAYEALAGEPPFARAHPGRMLTAIVAGDRKPLPTTLPGQVRRVIDRAVHPERERRFAHPEAFAAALEQAVTRG